MSCVGQVIQSDDLIKEIFEKSQLTQVLGLSASKIKRCWHAFGRVLRQQLLEILGERWYGGGVAVVGFGCWMATRKTENGPCMLLFALNPGYAKQHTLKASSCKKWANVCEIDFSKISAIAKIPSDSVVHITRAMFARIGDQAAVNEINILIPHVGRIESKTKKLSFIYLPELVDVLEPDVPLPRPRQPSPKIVSSVQTWLISTVSAQSDMSIHKQVAKKTLESHYKRPSSIVTGCPANAARALLKSRTSKGSTTASTKDIPTSRGVHNFSSRPNSSNGPADNSFNISVGMGSLHSVAASFHTRPKSATTIDRSGLQYNNSICMSHPNSTFNSTVKDSESKQRPLGKRTTTTPNAALDRVMADAYQRHEDRLSREAAEENRYRVYINSKIREAEEHEKEATNSRLQLMRKTSEALGIQVGEKRNRGADLVFMKNNVIPQKDKPAAPIPQEPLTSIRNVAKERQLLCSNLDKQVAEKAKFQQQAIKSERKQDAKIVSSAMKELVSETKANQRKRQDIAKDLNKAWQLQMQRR